MKLILNKVEYGYKAYRDSNTDGDMWVASITSVDGVKRDMSGDSGYLDFSEDPNGTAMWERTREKLYRYIDRLNRENLLFVVHNNS